MEYYDKNILMALVTIVGRPIKMNICIMDDLRGRFARVCVEIYLRKPVVRCLWF
uniref:DUF4283 domain-containing protein n=1 Tax=Cajanus cajan TaxID=3821 RepID=A0A151UEW6_CAJCA